MQSEIIKFAARLCLVTQLTGILSGTFIPVMALAKEDTSPRTLFASRTALYVLKSGDTVESVAKQFGLSVAELKKLNEFRTYSKPFEQLNAGDEVDVPALSLAKDGAAATVLSPDDENARLWAQGASQAGSLFSSDDASSSVNSMARGAASRAATAEVEGWLNKFGTAKVELSLNEDFKFDRSSVDFLYPFYDANDHTLFTQLGYRNKNDRNTINVGLGFRTFQGDWMYGINTFYDEDITGHNRRIGFGLEAWTDYLRLSANNYNGITDWHQSRDFEDYDERPADGFDFRTEGWLPAYPQLGGKLVYEQYSGDEVALFSKDDRSDDPKAITLGLNYTPFPLMTVGIDHRRGQGGQNDTSINLQFNYRLDMPWSAQTDPSAVSASRTLAGSRYDLVNRNNDVVLEYKKQELISLGLPPEMNGKAGDTAPLTATVKSKYGTDRVEWDAGSLIAAGGSITQRSPSNPVIQVTYPPYNTSPGSNVYNISAVAYDVKGNQSNRGTTVIYVSEPDAGIASGDLIITQDKAIANGTAFNIAQAKVTDASGNPVKGATVNFTTADGDLTIVTASATTNASGVATTELTSLKAGTYTLSAQVGSTTAVTAEVMFVADKDTATVATLTVNRAGVLNNNIDSVEYTALVKDINGNIVPGVAVAWETTLNAFESQQYETDATGKAKAVLKGTGTGNVTVSAVVNGNKKENSEVKFITNPVGDWIIDSDTSTYVSDGVYGFNSMGFTVSPPLTGPTSLVWGGSSTGSDITVPVSMVGNNGVEYTLNLKGYRSSDCSTRNFNDAVICSTNSKGIRAKLTYSRADNPGIPPGQYTGSMPFNAVAWTNTPITTFDITIFLTVD